MLFTLYFGSKLFDGFDQGGSDSILLTMITKLWPNGSHIAFQWVPSPSFPHSVIILSILQNILCARWELKQFFVSRLEITNINYFPSFIWIAIIEGAHIEYNLFFVIELHWIFFKFFNSQVGRCASLQNTDGCWFYPYKLLHADHWCL